MERRETYYEELRLLDQLLNLLKSRPPSQRLLRVKRAVLRERDLIQRRFTELSENS